METKVVHCQLIAKETDYAYYTTYVFKVDKDDPFYDYSAYCMVVRYPNWEHRELQLGEKGYLKFIEVIAGIDKYWNGQDTIPYNYSTWQFIKFVEEQPIRENSELIVD